MASTTERMRVGRITGGLAWLVTRLRWPIVLIWVAGAVAASLYLPALGENADALGGLVPANAKALETQKRSAELFGVPLATETAVVQRSPAGLTPDAQSRLLERAAALNQTPAKDGIAFALPVMNTRGLVPASRERGTTAITFLYFAPGTSGGDQDALAHDFADSQVNQPGDHLVGVTGALPARLAEFDRITGALPLVEIATLTLIALILGFTFRSIGAPLVTLFSAGIAYFVTIRVVEWLGERAGVVVPREIEPLVVVLLLGIVTDYAIFLLSGLRARLELGDRRLDASERATAQYVPIVFTAGLIVAAGAAALLAGRLEFFRAIGPGMALTALVGLAVSLTLIPALMAIFGRWLLWPGRHHAVLAESAAGEAAIVPVPDRRSVRFRLAHFATARPAALLLVVLAGGVLAVAASGMRLIDLGFTNVTGLPADAEPRVAEEAASKGFAPGILAPTEVVLEAPRLGTRRDGLVKLEGLVDRQPGVAGVVGPREEPADIESGVVVSKDGNAARLAVIFDAEPLGGAAIEDLRGLREAMPGLVQQAGLGGTSVAYSGQTALAEETVSLTVGDLERIAIAGLLVNLLLLIVFLRSFVAPLFLLASSVLAVGAALGITAYVFQGLLGYDEITYYVPFAAAVLLVALGSDYNVYVVGQVWEEASGRPLREAIATAVPRASRTITVAGIALAFSFALLAIVPLRAFRELAFTLCVGVLIDAFVVRSVLVPSLISLFGNASWWPGGRFRRRANPAALTEPGEAQAAATVPPESPAVP